MNHPVEQWKKIILNLPESLFFDIVRLYLGKIETPFNKHKLTEALVSQINKKVMIDRIISLISSADELFLTAIIMLKNPSVDELYRLLKDSVSYIEFAHAISNLEERLLIYREQAGGKFHVNITPLFRDIIISRFYNPGIIFPSRELEAPLKGFYLMNDALLCAVFSFILENGSIHKVNGEFTKKGKELFGEKFRLLGTKESGIEKLSGYLFQSLNNLGLYSPGNSSDDIIEKWERIINTHSHVRFLALTAASLEAEAQFPANLPVIQKRMELLQWILRTFVSGRSYSRATIQRITAASSTSLDTDPMVTMLIDTGIFLPLETKKKEKREYVLNSSALQVLNGKETESGTRPSIQSNGEIHVPETIPLEDLFSLGLSSNLVSYDTLSTYEITKTSYSRALDYGFSTEQMLEKLAFLGTLPPNLSFHLSDWEKNFSQMEVFSGDVLVIDESRRKIIASTGILKPWIHTELSPGIYVMKGERRGWTEALIQAGFDIPPRFHDIPTSAVTKPNEYLYLRKPVIQGLDVEESGETELSKNDTSFLDTIEKKIASSSFTAEQREVFQARLKKKLIIDTAQLSRDSLKQETREAKGIDYQAKMRLISESLKTGDDLLEISTITSDYEIDRILAKPIKLEKMEETAILTCLALPEEQELEFKVQSISFLKQLKGSLFSPMKNSIS